MVLKEFCWIRAYVLSFVASAACARKFARPWTLLQQHGDTEAVVWQPYTAVMTGGSHGNGQPMGLTMPTCTVAWLGSRATWNLLTFEQPMSCSLRSITGTKPCQKPKLFTFLRLFLLKGGGWFMAAPLPRCQFWFSMGNWIRQGEKLSCFSSLFASFPDFHRLPPFSLFLSLAFFSRLSCLTLFLSTFLTFSFSPYFILLSTVIYRLYSRFLSTPLSLSTLSFFLTPTFIFFLNS